MKDLVQTEGFEDILSSIRLVRKEVYTYANASLINLYYTIGAYVSDKVEKSNWGKSVVEQLADYIKENEPSIKGFTASNIWRMKQFYETYKNSPHCGENLDDSFLQLSWSHHRRIMTLKSDEERSFYLKLCIENRYSVRELEKLIKTGTFERTMLANKSISAVIQDLPQNTENVFKDTYVFDFLDITRKHSEKTLQKALISSLKDFILELGSGFTFIGEEYRISVGNDDFYIDLLFFHRKLECLVAFELKTDKFKPSYMGQLEFYLEALDRDVKLDNENPSIGVLICKEKDKDVVEYALSRSLSPTVISEYETQLIPKKLLKDKLNELYAAFDEKHLEDI